MRTTNVNAIHEYRYRRQCPPPAEAVLSVTGLAEALIAGEYNRAEMGRHRSAHRRAASCPPPTEPLGGLSRFQIRFIEFERLSNGVGERRPWGGLVASHPL